MENSGQRALSLLFLAFFFFFFFLSFPFFPSLSRSPVGVKLNSCIDHDRWFQVQRVVSGVQAYSQAHTTASQSGDAAIFSFSIFFAGVQAWQAQLGQGSVDGTFEIGIRRELIGSPASSDSSAHRTGKTGCRRLKKRGRHPCCHTQCSSGSIDPCLPRARSKGGKVEHKEDVRGGG